MKQPWTRDFHYAASYTILLTMVPFLLLLAVIFREILLLGLALFFTLFVYANKWYINYVAAHLFIPHVANEVRLFPEDEGVLHVPFENRGKIPIFNGKWGFHLFDHEEAVSVLDDQQPSSYKRAFNVPSQTKREYKTYVKGVKRGISQVRSIEVVLYDVFKLSSVRMVYQGTYRGEVIVYPKPAPVENLDTHLQQSRGSHTKPHSLYEEMTMTRGSREYRTGDPFNRINWKTTARSGELQTNIYEKVTLSKWTLVLNLRAENPLIPTLQNLEDVLSQVACALQYATKQGITYEMFINVKIPGSSTGLHVEADEGKKHLMTCLEVLARLRHGQITINEQLMMKKIFEHNGTCAVFHFGTYGKTEEDYYSHASQKGTSISIITPPGLKRGRQKHEEVAT
ncbi:DUF58 domain-containing protein [Alteribacter keqinensis]|uniref:DUF58 domain-containing protein n=1 Tax=Alteribacter keqinensis TaxID=2483800 RepID=A0A3M7TXZ1_9BACI|nr:DUF58 domain-containing protein [Alteribacter keqinensis]RNA70470.1 DUF58 domain-containing protein [Alteribacter keqinensis]